MSKTQKLFLMAIAINTVVMMSVMFYNHNEKGKALARMEYNKQIARMTSGGGYND